MSPSTKKKPEQQAGMLRIRQVGSGIGCPAAMRETLRALGLGKMHRVAERQDTKEVRGMIAKIPHLVEVVE
ncbi:MAG: 50S ribosomal protein L30 [Thermoanaerobaculia bacterium]